MKKYKVVSVGETGQYSERLTELHKENDRLKQELSKMESNVKHATEMVADMHTQSVTEVVSSDEEVSCEMKFQILDVWFKFCPTNIITFAILQTFLVNKLRRMRTMTSWTKCRRPPRACGALDLSRQKSVKTVWKTMVSGMSKHP